MKRHLGEGWVLPYVDDLNRAWYTSGEIRVQHCEDCGVFQHPPDELCSGCQGTRLAFAPCPGGGTVESVAVVHHAVHPGLKDRVPYAVAVISIDGAPGANAIGNVVNRGHDEVEIGLRVRAVFEDAEDPNGGDPLRIPQWEAV